MRNNYQQLSRVEERLVHALLNCILTCGDKMRYFFYFLLKARVPQRTSFPVSGSKCAAPEAATSSPQQVKGRSFKPLNSKISLMGGGWVEEGEDDRGGWRGECQREGAWEGMSEALTCKCWTMLNASLFVFLYGLRLPKPDNRWDLNYKSIISSQLGENQ